MSVLERLVQPNAAQFGIFIAMYLTNDGTRIVFERKVRKNTIVNFVGTEEKQWFSVLYSTARNFRDLLNFRTSQGLLVPVFLKLSGVRDSDQILRTKTKRFEQLFEQKNYETRHFWNISRVSIVLELFRENLFFS